MSRARELSRLGNPNIVKATAAYNVGFGTEVPLDPASSTTVISAGIVSATKFFGDGAGLEGVASAGLGSAISADATSPNNSLYYVNKILDITEDTTVTVPTTSTSNIAYTNYQEIKVDDSYDFTIADGDDLMLDILNLQE